MKKCPFCAEDIQEEAIKCKHCGEWLEEKKMSNKIEKSDQKNKKITSDPSGQEIDKSIPEFKNRCRHCEKLVPDRSENCIYCGGTLTFYNNKICPECDTENPRSNARCIGCGYPFNERS